MKEQINKGTIFKYMKESLKLNIRDHTSLVNQTLKNMIEANILQNPNKDLNHLYNYYENKFPEIEKLILECYISLIIQGIIVPGPTAPNFADSQGWNQFRITEYGKEWIKTEIEPIPEDDDGLIRYIKEAIPNIDKVILQYLSESLSTFNSNHTYASAVMLGAASEKLIYLIAEALKNSINDTNDENKISENLEKRRLKALFTTISKILDKSIKNKKIPYSIHEDCHDYLNSLFSSIRIQRNDAVHPIAGDVNRQKLRLLLLSFPQACKKSYDIMNWLKKNQI